MKWGPDGWLYGANGSTSTGNVKNPATGKMVKWEGAKYLALPSRYKGV